jgi:hypothetical protein
MVRGTRTSDQQLQRRAEVLDETDSGERQQPCSKREKCQRHGRDYPGPEQQQVHPCGRVTECAIALPLAPDEERKGKGDQEQVSMPRPGTASTFTSLRISAYMPNELASTNAIQGSRPVEMVM